MNTSNLTPMTNIKQLSEREMLKSNQALFQCMKYWLCVRWELMFTEEFKDTPK